MEPILTKYIREPQSYTLDFYLKQGGGYGALKKALAMTPEAVIEAVKQSGLRGRGGAGFPTGMKWQFIDKKSPKPRYICCNADESEPGTFKDHVLMERNPHLLFEGCLIGCYAIGAKVAYIYIRGEFYHVQEVLEAELAKARAAGYIGQNLFGSGFDCEIHVHRGAGAYEAGEETALIESLEGKRAQPRLKPPFPAASGLYNCPSAVNNVETLCNLPAIMTRGAAWFTSLGPDKNGGPKLFCVSGHVKKPGVFEADMNTTLRELIYDRAGGIDPAPEPARRARELRRRGQGRIDAGLGGHHRHGRDHLYGVGGAQPALLLQARVVRQVHTMPRRRRLAAQDPDPDRERGRGDARHRSAGQHREQHRR